MKDIKLGNLTVKKIFESDGAMPVSMVLPETKEADLAELKKWYWSDELSLDPESAMFKLSMHSYLLEINDLKILIDTCNGNDKSRSMEFADKLQTPYLENFAKTGITPEEIDIVMCTHLHCDHVGWNTRLQDGQWVPTFPNARYIFSQKDYDFFVEQQHEALHREAFDDSVLPVVEAGLAEMVDSDYIVDREIGEGVWMSDASGHSPGACVIYAQDGGPLAIFSGDTFHHPLLIGNPGYKFFADEDAQKAVATRKALLSKHADTDAVFFPAHFGGSSAGKVVRVSDDKYRYDFIEK